jgi:hypothetical protein
MWQADESVGDDTARDHCGADGESGLRCQCRAVRLRRGYGDISTRYLLRATHPAQRFANAGYGLIIVQLPRNGLKAVGDDDDIGAIEPNERAAGGVRRNGSNLIRIDVDNPM